MTKRTKLAVCASSMTYFIGMVLISGVVSVAQAGTIDAIYAFRDSLSEVGNICTLTGGVTPGAPYVNGQFTNGNVWVQNLAIDLGLPPLTPSQLGGGDYAYGAAETGITSFNIAPANTDLTGPGGQISQLQAAHPAADPNALYTIWIGSNDSKDMLANRVQAQYGADITTIADNIDSAMNTLAGLGAKNFLIVNVPDLGRTPAAQAFGPAASAGASEVSGALDALLAAAYGLTNVTQPCLSGGTACATPAQHYFWDELHPTAKGYPFLAGDAADLVTPERGSFFIMGIATLVLSFLLQDGLRQAAGKRISTRRHLHEERSRDGLSFPIWARFVRLLAIWLLPLIAHAQTIHDWEALRQLRPGDRIAVSVKANNTVDGTFKSWSQEGLVLDKETFPKEQVQKVRRYRTGVWSRRKTALVGAAIGGVAGLALGIGGGGNCGRSIGPCFSRPALGGALAGIGAILGAGIGALIPHRHLDLIYSST